MLRIYFRLMIILLIIQSFSIGLYAQSVIISGKVTEEGTGTGLPGVTIREKSTQNGTITDKDGKYQLSVGENAILIFSSVGFATIEVPVNNQRTLDVALTPADLQLGEVVVTALGIERNKTECGYIIQEIDTKSLHNVKSPNLIDIMAGKVAGVTISQGATGVGSTSKIVIRGESSFTNNNPLFVVDGVPVNNNSIVNFTNDAAAGFQEVDFGNGGMEISPDDIDNITVLKGPGAAALYGTRASNGVIIITTKTGEEKGAKEIGVSINSTTYIDRAFRLPKFQNLYGQGNSGSFRFVDGLGGGVNDNISYSWGPRLDQGTLIPQFDSPVTIPGGSVIRGGDVAVHGGADITPTPFVAYPNNLKDFYQTGVTTINNVALSGGNEKGNYRLSLTDLQSESIIPGVNLDRRTVTANLSFKPTEALKVTSTIYYINSSSHNRPSSGYGSENVNYSLVAWGPRSLDISKLADYWQPGLENLQQYSFNYTFFDNPYFILHENRNSFSRDRLLGNIAATYQLTDQLSLLIRSGTDYSSEQRQFRRAFSTNRFANGAYAVHDVDFRENNTDFLLNYQKISGDMTFDLSFGGNRMDQRATTVQTQALSLAQPGIFSLSNAASPLEVFIFLSRKRINSLYGLAKFGYKEYLFLEATARNDWSSALATPTSTDNVSFFYPSLSASWILSELWSLPASMELVKLRASVAQVGNDTNPYQTAGVFNAQTPYNSQPTFSEQATIPNANLLPEQTTSLELGTELRLFHGIAKIDFTYYNALTKNQIISLPVSVTSGAEQQVINGGEVRSRGIELYVDLLSINRKVTWNTIFNFSRNVTTVESLPNQVDRLTLAYSRVYDNVNQTVFFQVDEGGRVGDIYGTGYRRNEDGEFIVDNNGLYIADNNLKKLGNYNPDFILGMANEVAYRNWTFNFLFDWRKGGIIVSRTLALAGVGGQLEETAHRPEEGIIAPGVVNTGTEENPVYVPNTQRVSAETFYRNFYDRNHEENNVYNASYLKLREVSIKYTVPASFVKGSELTISLIGRNLFAISEIPHFDPEQLAVQGNQFVSGVEDMSYATTRSIGINLGLKF